MDLPVTEHETLMMMSSRRAGECVAGSTRRCWRGHVGKMLGADCDSMESLSTQEHVSTSQYQHGKP